MIEVRYRADGHPDTVAMVDAFKVTRYGRVGDAFPGPTEWRVAPLYPWARAMARAWATVHHGADSAMRDQLGRGQPLAFATRAAARDWIAEVAGWARSGWLT